MSLLNAWISKDRGLIAVDTEGMDHTGARFPFSKLIPLVHANTVVAARGDRYYLARFYQYFYLTIDHAVASDYDSIAANSLLALASVNQHCRDPSAADTPYHVVVAGWSPARERMQGVSFEGSTHSVDVDVQDLGQIASPAGCIEKPMVLSDHGTMLRLARLQAPWLRKAGAPGGGDLVIAEVSKGRIDITTRRI